MTRVHYSKAEGAEETPVSHLGRLDRRGQKARGGAVAEQETLEKGIVVAGLEALREVGGEALVQVVLSHADRLDLAQGSDPTERVPLEAYLGFRDSLLELLGDGFASTAFETGRIVARKLKHEREGQVRALLRQFEHARNKLPAIGQAAVLSAHGSPGVVEARMDGETLRITIRDCPECRNLERTAPFCYLNQGVITEFASAYLGFEVQTSETACAAMGDPVCEIAVTR